MMGDKWDIMGDDMEKLLVGKNGEYAEIVPCSWDIRF